ncbi:MAG: hypothetical protein ABI723_09300 [Bacteroidia bacterium]
MAKSKFTKTFLATLIMLLSVDKIFPCSMYKITVNGKTMVGCNHDTWYLTPRIWFETSGYGACFTGARYDGDNGFAPQSGMNEFGLTFSRLAAATPENETVAANKKQITNATNYLKDILHKCKTVDEVKNYIDQFDHSSFSRDVFIYIDKSGRYLIVEPYTMTEGNDSEYVLANFCPSQVTDFSSIKQVRYVNGVAFLKTKTGTDIDFCTALSDTMHVCRKKIGDGTLLTSIWDVNEGITYLYFYHDYKHLVKFNVKDELAKGNHILEIPPLFPPNKEFKKLSDFKTPLNSKAIDMFLRFCFGLFLFSALYFLVNYFSKGTTTKYVLIKLALFPLSLIMMYYMFVLASEMNIFYFPAPYKDYKFSMLNIAAYIPFMILLLIIPLYINRKIFKENAWRNFSKWLFTLNNLAYLALIIMFTYWGLYNVFN